jgi:hypothetical protein
MPDQLGKSFGRNLTSFSSARACFNFQAAYGRQTLRADGATI